MKCPVCEINIPDEVAHLVPCEKCGCKDLMTEQAKQNWRVKSELEGVVMTLVRAKKEQ